MKRASVRRTAEFVRVDHLPRRELTQKGAEAWAEALTPRLLRDGARGSLRPWQAYSLAEAAENDGAWLALPVGLGKTLIAELLPVVMGKSRPVLIVPAALRDKTFHDRAQLVGTWRLPRTMARVVSLEELAREDARDLLERLAPDLFIIDEADELANFSAAAAKRIDREVRRTGAAVVAMTGTPGRKSIMNYWHLLCWALKDGAPVPLDEAEAKVWAQCLDEAHGRAWTARVAPGPLGPTLARARLWFGERLRATPGVVVVDGDSCQEEIAIEIVPAPESKVLDEHFRRLLKEGENPRGVPIADPLARFRAEAQTGCGYCQFWDPPPPDDWVEARRAFARFSRAAIDRSARTSSPLDTEKQVRRRYASHPIVSDWEELAPTFEPNTSVEWLDDSAIEAALAWLKSSPEPGVVWCGSVEFAERLAERAGLSYYARQGRDQNGRGLHAAPEGQSMVCSWHANKRGFNLQAWGRALIVYPPQSAKFLEQTFGRHHRAGRRGGVHITILATSGAIYDALDAALAEAGFVQGTIGLTQKILRADIRRVEPKTNKSNRYRWARKER